VDEFLKQLMLVGYARVSTVEQNLDLQVEALKKAGCGKIFKERSSGVREERPELQSAFQFMRKGDVLAVWRLDRLGRSLKHLLDIVTQLELREIGFRSLQESVDTTTSGGRLVFQIFGALAEFERNLIRERTYAGLAVARARGKNGGRPNALDLKKVQLLYQLYDEKRLSIIEICQMLGVSKPTFYNYLGRRSK